jgi:hypothetical protein
MLGGMEEGFFGVRARRRREQGGDESEMRIDEIRARVEMTVA